MQPMSDVACDWLWVTCLKLKSDPQFVDPWYVREVPSYVPNLAFTSTGPR